MEDCRKDGDAERNLEVLCVLIESTEEASRLLERESKCVERVIKGMRWA